MHILKRRRLFSRIASSPQGGRGRFAKSRPIESREPAELGEAGVPGNFGDVHTLAIRAKDSSADQMQPP
jgi:hypothetical protein